MYTRLPSDGNVDLFPIPGRPLNPAELKIDLLCRGVRVEGSGLLEEAHPFACTPAGLGSGLEMIIPAEKRDLYVNVPVIEKFVERTPYMVRSGEAGHYLVDERQDHSYLVRLASRPGWYDTSTSTGKPMGRVGSLHGTYLSIYIGGQCDFWLPANRLNCKFCATGMELMTEDFSENSVDEVVETAGAARRESRISFVQLNSGYHPGRGVAEMFPFVRAIKEKAGLLVGIQALPERNLEIYDRLLGLGTDHLSVGLEFFNSEYFRHYAPGKAELLGREVFYRAIEYCARKLGKGRVWGQLIAGLEPVEDTLRGIDRLIRLGAVPIVCVFRPLAGSVLEHHPPPAFSDMAKIFRHVYESCRMNNMPLGIAPNVNFSLSLQPEDTFYFSSNSAADRIYQRWVGSLRHIMRPYFSRRMRPQASED